MNGFYEPWIPEIGQRVTYRKAAECPIADDLPDGLQGVIYHVEHPRSENGVEPGHRFWVEWDTGHTTYTAAIELEPVS